MSRQAKMASSFAKWSRVVFLELRHHLYAQTPSIPCKMFSIICIGNHMSLSAIFFKNCSQTHVVTY